MTDDDTTPTAAQLTRRDTLRSGGALASLLGGGVTHDLAGGPAADAMSEHRVPLYRVPEPDLDSPGVVGRRVEITAGGSTYAAGDQLVDTGSSWERISPGYDSLNTVRQSHESYGAGAGPYPLGRDNPGSPTHPEMSGPISVEEHPSANNPIITAADLNAAQSDYTADFIADPFIRYIEELGRFDIWAEIVTDTGDRLLGLWRSVDGFQNWQYQGVASASGADINASYPHFYQKNGVWYCTPSGGARIFEIEDYGNNPLDWTEVDTYGSEFTGSIKDATFFKSYGRWWIFGGQDVEIDGTQDQIAVRYSEQTDGGPDGLFWTEPSWSPITTDAGSDTKRESPAGRPIVHADGSITMPYKDQTATSPNIDTISAYRHEFDIDTHADQELSTSPIAYPRQFEVDNSGQGTTHQLDWVLDPVSNQTICVVDVGTPWEICLGTLSSQPPQTDVLAVQEPNKAISTANQFYSPDFTVVDDALSEFDASDTAETFSPRRSGDYQVDASVTLLHSGSSADGDQLKMRLRNVTDGVTIGFSQGSYANTTSSGWETLTINSKFKLNSSKEYKIEVTNVDNDDFISGDADKTRISIQKA